MWTAANAGTTASPTGGSAPCGAPTAGERVMVTCTNCERRGAYICVCVCVYVQVCVSVTRTFGDLLKKGVQKFEEVNSYFVSV